jgi:sugar phosphate isomerase/epimerase
MKIGIRQKGYLRWGEDRYRKAREHGFACIDFNMMDTDASIYVLPEHRVEAMMLAERALAEASGLTFYQSHGPWRTPKDATPKDRAERMEKMKRSLWAASLLGCKNWVIHPILPCGGCERNKPEAERTWELNLEFWSALLPTAKQYGMTICLENLPFLDFSLAKPQDVLRLVKAIDDPNVKICLDTGHVATFERLSAADAVRELGSEIRAFHVHDSRPRLDLHLFPFFGVTDWKDFSRALREIDYQGALCLETEPPASLPDDIHESLCRELARIADRIANHPELI